VPKINVSPEFRIVHFKFHEYCKTSKFTNTKKKERIYLSFPEGIILDKVSKNSSILKKEY
jgi:hypothetical protein